MKKKPPQAAEQVVPREILERAKSAAHPDRPKPTCKCVICGSECAPNSTEGLCWVCRRLKISAWRDSDAQAPAQE
jgi:hypothetical protein